MTLPRQRPLCRRTWVLVWLVLVSGSLAQTNQVPPSNRRLSEGSVAVAAPRRARTASVAPSSSPDAVQEDTIVILSLLSLVNTAVFVVPNTIRYALAKRQCLQGRRQRRNGCVCTEDQLRSAIATSRALKRTDMAVIVLCPALQLTVTQEINVTNASFRVVCAISKFINVDPCILSNDGSNRFFVGAPRHAAFQDVIVRGGQAVTEAAKEAMYVTGGNWTFHDVTLDSPGSGATIYIAPTVTAIPAYVTLFGTTTFARSTLGRDVFIATTSNVTRSTTTGRTSAFVECKASTLLDQPIFCNGEAGIVVQSPEATSIEKAIYTNCFDVAEFQC